MKQTLALKLGQQLTMTPQLQQAIRLLQLSSLDLQQEIQSVLDENPLLEQMEDDAIGETDSDDSPAESELLQNESDPDELSEVSESLEQPMGEEMPVDSQWEDVYPNGSSLPAPDSDYDPMSNRAEPQTLQDYLLWQLNLTPMAPSDRLIAGALIDAIEPSGMLGASLEEICQALADHEVEAEDQVSMEDVLGVLERIQLFDPVGVGARNLQECLVLQLDSLPPATPWLAEARALITEHLDLLGSKDFNTLRRKTKLGDEELAAIAALIRTLNPRPGSAVSEEAADYIIPDVIVRKSAGQWVVELNNDATPQVRINPLYEGLLKEDGEQPHQPAVAISNSDRSYIRDNLQEARWFLKSLQTRNDTLLRVASKIVEVQRGFLEYGPQAMKPLILADIAEAVELHESTISRITTRKYMATPRGVYELKYFFSSHVGTATGGEVSSTAIRALISKLTAEEDPRKPLSDSKIAAILKQQQINVARRTVAKYRESLSIPPSNERKQLV